MNEGCTSFHKQHGQYDNTSLNLVLQAQRTLLCNFEIQMVLAKFHCLMPWEDKKLDKKKNPRLIFETSSASLLLETGTGNNDWKQTSERVWMVIIIQKIIIRKIIIKTKKLGVSVAWMNKMFHQQLRQIVQISYKGMAWKDCRTRCYWSMKNWKSNKKSYNVAQTNRGFFGALQLVK